MKKNQTTVRKFILVAVFVALYFLVGGNLFNTTTSASTGNVISNINGRLMQENDELKKNYAVLEQRLLEMERTVKQIYEEDNQLYAAILGVDFDTLDYHKFRNDSATFVFTKYDSMFSKLNQRSLYASEMLALELKKLEETSTSFKNNKYRMLYYPTISPVKTQDFIYVSSPYGIRQDPISKNPSFHEGLDIAAYVGVPVHVTASGTVVKIMYSKYGYGNRILIKHKYGFETLYAHLDVIKVKEGQWVNKNQVIGTIGNTGKSTGPHLHYEIHKNGQPRDPMGYFYTHLSNELLAMQ